MWDLKEYMLEHFRNINFVRTKYIVIYYRVMLILFNIGTNFQISAHQFFNKHNFCFVQYQTTDAHSLIYSNHLYEIHKQNPLTAEFIILYLYPIINLIVLSIYMCNVYYAL